MRSIRRWVRHRLLDLRVRRPKVRRQVAATLALLDGGDA
jgi:hypothetical protein